MKLVIDTACSWPEFTQENFVSAWKPNKKVMRLKMRGNFYKSEAARRAPSKPNYSVFPELNLAKSMGVMRIYPCIV